MKPQSYKGVFSSLRPQDANGPVRRKKPWNWSRRSLRKRRTKRPEAPEGTKVKRIIEHMLRKDHVFWFQQIVTELFC